MSDKSTEPSVWIEEHGDTLFRYAMYRLRDPEAAEDAVQETLLAAIRAKKSFEGQSTVRTWLIGILRHKCVDYIRKASRERPVTDMVSADADEDDNLDGLFDKHGHWKKDAAEGWPGKWPGSPAQALENEEFRSILAQCMEELPERQARAFALREVDGMKGPEICQVLDVTATNLWAMLHRARRRLRHCLDQNWFKE